MNPRIIKKEAMMLAGFSFFGNPFEESDPWSEGNEIGKLWQRFMAYWQQNGSDLNGIAAQNDVFYEVHISHPETALKSVYEVFIGVQVDQMKSVPLQLLVKVLPATQYAVFTLEGEEINSDWHFMIYQQWMPHSGYSAAYEYGFQSYDDRFKGMDNLVDSVLDVYIPIK